MTETARIAMLKRQIARGGCRPGGTPNPARARALRCELDGLEIDRADRALAAELASIDAAWDALVTATAAAFYGRPGDYKYETAHRNKQARKRRARGLGPLETVAAEMRRRAEDEVLAVLVRRAGEPCVVAMQAMVDRGEEIRSELARRTDVRAGWLAS